MNKETARLSWIERYQPDIDCDPKKSKNGDNDSCYLTFWDSFKADYTTIYGSTLEDCVDKAMEYCETVDLVSNDYTDYFTIRIGNISGTIDIDYKDIVFKLPYAVLDVSDIRKAYVNTCAKVGVSFHKPRSFEIFTPLFKNNVLNEDAKNILKKSNIFIQDDINTMEDFILALQLLISYSNENVYLEPVNVPEKVIQYLPSFNNIEYAPERFTFGEFLFK